MPKTQGNFGSSGECDVRYKVVGELKRVTNCRNIVLIYFMQAWSPGNCQFLFFLLRT